MPDQAITLSDDIFAELRKIDTPTITNVVATYPGRPLCLEIYNPLTENWYTNNTLQCWYPELGPIAGYAVTCTYGVPDPAFKKLSLMDVLEAMDRLGKPSIFCFQQKFPAEIADKIGLSGGNMTSSMRACGAIGAVSNGPSRDIHEIRPCAGSTSSTPTMVTSLSSTLLRSFTVAPNFTVLPESLEKSITSAREMMSSTSAMRPIGIDDGASLSASS